jgi:hypothetical protein
MALLWRRRQSSESPGCSSSKLYKSRRLPLALVPPDINDQKLFGFLRICARLKLMRTQDWPVILIIFLL